MLTNGSIISSTQAIRIRSGVAGLSSGNHSLDPTSALAAIMASLMAKKTADAKKNGGSPTALDEWMAFTFGWPYQLVKETTEWILTYAGRPSKFDFHKYN